MTGHAGCTGARQTRPYCGRPLGIRRFDATRFMVIDAVLGLFFVDFERGGRRNFLCLFCAD
jgi:hypothetical protein